MDVPLFWLILYHQRDEEWRYSGCLEVSRFPHLRTSRLELVLMNHPFAVSELIHLQ